MGLSLEHRCVVHSLLFAHWAPLILEKVRSQEHDVQRRNADAEPEDAPALALRFLEGVGMGTLNQGRAWLPTDVFLQLVRRCELTDCLSMILQRIRSKAVSRHLM